MPNACIILDKSVTYINYMHYIGQSVYTCTDALCMHNIGQLSHIVTYIVHMNYIGRFVHKRQEQVRYWSFATQTSCTCIIWVQCHLIQELLYTDAM